MVHCWSVRLVGVAALLYVLCLTPLLVGLLWHVLLDVVALGPGHGIADLLGDVLTILLVLELSDGSVALLALLLGDLVADLAGGGDVLTHLYNKADRDNKIITDITCFGTWLQTLLVTVEHLRSETSLVWILGTREQTRLDFFWQSLTGTSWQDWRLSSWQSTFCTSMHLCFGSS